MSKYKTAWAAAAQIADVINTGGEYTHNIISSILRTVAQDFGKEAANKIVEEMELEELFGICKEA